MSTSVQQSSEPPSPQSTPAESPSDASQSAARPGRWRRRLLNPATLSVLFSFGVRASGSVITLLMNIVMVRVIGANEASYFLLAFNYLMVTAAFGRVGTESVVLKSVAAATSDDQPGEARAAYWKCQTLSTTVSLVVAALTVLLAGVLAEHVFHKTPMQACLQYIAPAIVVFNVYTLIARALQGFKWINLSVFIVNCSTNLGVIVLLLLVRPDSSATACGLFSAAAMVSLVIGQLTLGRLLTTGDGTTDWRSLWTTAWPLWIGVVVETIIRLAGPLISGAFCEELEVTQLSLSQRVAMVITIALTAATHNAAPRIAAAWRQNNHDDLRATTQHAGRLSVLLSLPILIPMFVVPEFVLGLFSKEVSGGATLLRIMAVGQVVNVMCGPVSYVLQMCDMEKAMRNATLVAGTFAVFGGIALTWKFGAIGAAWSTAGSIILLRLLSCEAVRRRLGFHPMRILFRM